MDWELIRVVGRGDGLGRPLLYGVTQKFLEHFGLKDTADLPAADELPVILGGLGSDLGPARESGESPASAEDPA